MKTDYQRNCHLYLHLRHLMCYGYDGKTSLKDGVHDDDGEMNDEVKQLNEDEKDADQDDLDDDGDANEGMSLEVSSKKEVQLQ